MKKIILLSENQVLNNLISSNKQLNLVTTKSEGEVIDILQKGVEDYLLLISNLIIANSSLIKILNASELPLISLCNGQQDIVKIKFLEKPFHIGKLLTTIGAVERELTKKQFLLEECLFDLESRFIRKTMEDGSVQEVRLTEIEAKILNFFLNKNQKIRDKNTLLQVVWNHKNSIQMTDTGIVEVTINNLKKKLKKLQIDELIDFSI